MFYQKLHLPSVCGYILSTLILITYLTLSRNEIQLSALHESWEIVHYQFIYYFSIFQWFSGSLIMVSILGIILGKLSKNRSLVTTWRSLLYFSIGLILTVIGIIFIVI